MLKLVFFNILVFLTACGDPTLTSPSTPPQQQPSQKSKQPEKKTEHEPHPKTEDEKTHNEKAFYEWSDSDKSSFLINSYDKIDVDNKKHLKEEHELLESIISPLSFYSKKFLTASSLEKIPKDIVSELTLVFLNMNKAKWQNPIVGEVKYVNDRRYQFIGQHAGDDYGIVIGTDKFENLYLENFFGGGNIYTLKLAKTWQEVDEKEIGHGSYGKVYEVKFNNRVFAAKQNSDKSGNDKEIIAYEKLSDIEGIGPYLGQIQNNYILLEKGEPLDVYAPANRDVVKTFIQGLLKTAGEIHRRGIYHNDLKVNNIIVVNGKPHIIDFGNYSETSWQLGRGHGFTSPYYAVGDFTGIKADLRALGFVFFGIKHFDNPIFAMSFWKPEKKIVILQEDLKIADIYPGLKNGDNIDKVIAKLLMKEYKNAFEALAEIP